MIFYLIEISEGDSKIAGSSIYKYEDEKTAIGTLYQKYGNALKSDLYESEMIMVIDKHGSIYEQKAFDRGEVNG